MRTIRVYQSGDYQTGQSLELTPEASHHVGVVLRLQVGDCLTLFCGDNREFDALIELVKKKQIVVRVGAIKNKSRESPLSIHLAQAISKSNSMELVVQKAVELGVTSIIPVITERCVVPLDTQRMTKKRRQWQAIAIGACEQSGRNTVPVVHQPITLQQYLHEVQTKLRFILHPDGAQSWRDETHAIGCCDSALLIGPEGGFSPHEIQVATEYGFRSLSFGPRILRTETAAIAALSILQSLGGDL